MRTITAEALVLADTDGLPARFHRAGVLGLADVHAALALGRLGGESDESVVLAAALTVRALRGGSVCLDLARARDVVFETDETVVDTDDLPWPDPTAWLDACRASPLVAVGPDADGSRPLRLVDTTLYLERYWGEEETVRRQLVHRRGLPPLTVDTARLRAGLDRLFSPAELGSDEPDRQRIAAAAAVLGRVSVVAGGPGTGKTTTVAKILALLTDQPGMERARIALAAPTGKAAARLAEAVAEATAGLPEADAARIGDLPPFTLHRLLGFIWSRRGRFRHDADNHLPYEVIVVDEMSMVSLPLMARLLEAVRPDARLVLVGDPDQLSSVEAGAVLADITGAALGVGADGTTSAGPDSAAGGATTDGADEGATDGGTEDGDTEDGDARCVDPGVGDVLPALADDGRGLPVPDDVRGGVVRLRHTWRFGGAIGRLAEAVRTGDAETAVAIVAGGEPGVEFVAVDDDVLPTADRMPEVRRRVVAAARGLTAAAEAGDRSAALRSLDAHRLLCAHRTGPYGVTRWTREVERWLTEAHAGAVDRRQVWYPGRPLLIMANDYELGLFNGDTGVVVDTPTGPRAVFGRGSRWAEHAPSRLDEVQTVHAMTVHRGQGSQFSEVTFVVPPIDSPLLTRELLYTAITRAMTTVTLIGSTDAIARAVRRPANRASGLRHRL